MRVSRRLEWWLVATLLTGLVTLRAWPFLAWSGVHFDSDQAIVGLMAKHLAEGRAFPLFFYGQTYMLAVEAWLAAPIIAAMGATVAAVKLPLVAINIAIVLLLTRLVSVECRVRPLVAAIAALPLALPPAGIAARVVEANGGNVEPWLYVLLIWLLRDRAWLGGLVLGVGVLHREFTLYGAAALVVLDALGGRLRSRDRWSYWAIVAVTVTAVRAAVFALQPFASILGPGTRGDVSLGSVSDLAAVNARVCFAPELWADRLTSVLSSHLPLLFGTARQPLAIFGVKTEVVAGHPSVVVWAGIVTLVGIGAGLWAMWRRPVAQKPTTALPPPLGWYLVLVGLISMSVYTFVYCSAINIFTLRYDLLGTMLPVGCIVLGISVLGSKAARLALATAVVCWTAPNARDIVAVTQEYRRAQPADMRQITADVLVARGVTAAWAEFRIAYHVTFLAREEVRVAASDVGRIEEYAVAARVPGTPTISAAPCKGGQEIAIQVYLCPP